MTVDSGGSIINYFDKLLNNEEPLQIYDSRNINNVSINEYEKEYIKKFIEKNERGWVSDKNLYEIDKKFGRNVNLYLSLSYLIVFLKENDFLKNKGVEKIWLFNNSEFLVLINKELIICQIIIDKNFRLAKESGHENYQDKEDEFSTMSIYINKSKQLYSNLERTNLFKTLSSKGITIKRIFLIGFFPGISTDIDSTFQILKSLEKETIKINKRDLKKLKIVLIPLFAIARGNKSSLEKIVAESMKKRNQPLLETFVQIKRRTDSPIWGQNEPKDHRVLNGRLKIFGFNETIGSGLPIWLPNGTILKEEIKKYIQKKEWEYDYQRVESPILGTVDLYKKSGHWDHYRKNMFPTIKWDNENKKEMVLRPMNCPHHICIYKQTIHSYRELPIRLAEHAHQYRYEPSGSLSGLERVRSMELTDSHIFARPDQIETEFKQIYQMIKEVLDTFGIEIYYLSFSARDPKNKKKYYPDDKMWNQAEQSLEKVLKDLKLNYKTVKGEAAFYGPKLDIQIKNASGHEVTISTIQLDFLLPERFDVTYIDEKGKAQRPIMIHRGLIGTYERFIATLLEQTNGQLPLWLAPEQVTIIPVNEANHPYVEEVRLALKKAKIRTHIDKREERLGKKIRDTQLKKVPYQLVLGNKEQEAKLITYRRFGHQSSHTIPLTKFIEQLKTEIKQKS